MARIDPSLPAPAPSILDRLLAEEEAPGPARGSAGDASSTDRAPGGAGAGLGTWQDGVRAVKAAVMRDLEWLLNARNPRGLEDVANTEGSGYGTVIDFGLPDLTLLDLRDSTDRAKLERQIAVAIERHEPRLADVSVEFRGSEESYGRTRFHVEGTLLIEPQAVEFPFDTTINWLNRRVEVERESS